MQSLNLDRLKACFHWRRTQVRECDDTMLTGDAEISEASAFTEDEESSTFEPSDQDSPQHMSLARRLCFAASLFLCAFTVVIFGFLLPCHQPGCDKTNSCPVKVSEDWSVTFANSTPHSINLLDVSGNGHLDVVIRATRNITNVSYSTEIMALSGESGHSLWSFKRDVELGKLKCTHLQPPGCLLVEASSQILKIDVDGSISWSRHLQHVIYGYEFVSDMDGDGEQDVVALHDVTGQNLAEANQANLTILSGKNGNPLGISVTVPGKHSKSSMLLAYDVSKERQYILVSSSLAGQQAGSLWAISTSELVKKMRHGGDGTELSNQWGPYSPDPETDFILLLDGVFVALEPLLVDLNSDGQTDMVVCVKKSGLIALDGRNLDTLWNISVFSSDIKRLIAAGVSSYGPHVAMIIQSANNSTDLQVVDGLSGKVTWSFHSETMFPAPPVPVYYSLSQKLTFLVWLSGDEALKYLDNEKQKHGYREGTDQNWSLVMHKGNGALLHKSIASQVLETSEPGSMKHPHNSNRRMQPAGKVKRGAGNQGHGMQSQAGHCGPKSQAETAMFSAFLVWHDETIKVQHVTSVKPIYLDTEEYGNVSYGFGPMHQCVKFVPRNMLETLEGAMGKSGEPGMVYAVKFVEEPTGANYLMNVNKINLHSTASKN